MGMYMHAVHCSSLHCTKYTQLICWTRIAAPSNVTIVGVNFGVKAYGQQAFLDSLACTDVFASSDHQLACTANPINEIDIGKHFTLTTQILGRNGYQSQALSYVESWSRVTPISSYTLRSGAGAQITVHGRGFSTDTQGR